MKHSLWAIILCGYIWAALGVEPVDAQQQSFALRFTVANGVSVAVRTNGGCTFSMELGGDMRRDFNGRIQPHDGSPLAYNLNGKLSSLGGMPLRYDLNGRVIFIGGIPIRYDMKGRIEFIGGIHIGYDLNGRVQRIGNAGLIYDLNGRLNGIRGCVQDGVPLSIDLLSLP